MDKKELVFIIQGYESATDSGQLIDTVQIELYSKSVKEALKRAKKIIKKKFYRVSSIVEVKK